MLTGAQLDPVSYLLFISVFGVDITFWVRLVNSFLKVRTESILFRNYILDNTLDNVTADGDSDINDNNDDDDNDNHDSDDNNDDK